MSQIEHTLRREWNVVRALFGRRNCLWMCIHRMFCCLWKLLSGGKMREAI